MDCLDPPLLEIPQGNWFCDDCFETSDESDDDPEELDDLNNDIEDEMGQLSETRLRVRQHQPQILRTLQSERIRNAILARMSLRSAREALGEGPSTNALTRTRVVKKRRMTRKRKTRRRARTVVEYDVDGSDKFAMRTRRVTRKARKKRKVAKPTKRRVTKIPAIATTGFKNANQIVHELQRGRMMAGVSNFSIFEPSNQLDYVPDEEDIIEDSGIDDGAENSGGSILTQAIIGFHNPQRRNMMIKNRVLQNCTTTSNASNLLDTIMQDQSMFGPGSIVNKFAVEKSSGKLLFVCKNSDHARQSAGGDSSQSNGESKHNETTSDNPSTSTTGTNPSTLSTDITVSTDHAELSKSSDERNEALVVPSESFSSVAVETLEEKKKKLRKPAIDMFDESSNPEETTDSCPNFSIYDPVDAMNNDDESSILFQSRSNVYDEENVDLVQMSDNEQQNESSEEAPPAIVASQPASPDVENDKICEMIPERSYTPPITQKVSEDGPEKDDSNKKKKKEKEKESKRSRKRELERYNVRDRLKDRSPVKLKDKFGRNRSRSRSSPRKKPTKKRTRSISRDRFRKSRSPDRYRKSKSYSRSRSRRRTPSIQFDRRKKTHKEKPSKSNRRSRSRSLTPRHHRPATPDRRARSRSKKAKKKKHQDNSKEKPSTLTKEVFTSGPNILVSVNFNNQEEKSTTKRSKSQERNEPKEIVDITARKKITISSKPVAIIDLARSPFKELTPEYQSNVIELSDSDGEKAKEKLPDSTLSSKLYDPFEILNSPSNEKVTSSQNTAGQVIHQKQQEKLQEPAKSSMSYNKNVMAMATNSSLFFNEENLVTSSSSMATNEKQLPLLFTPAKADVLQNEKNSSKTDIVPIGISESPYSPGHEYDDSFTHQDESAAKSPRMKQSKSTSKAENIFNVLFGSSTPPGLDRVKSSNKKGLSQGDKPVDSNKYLMKMKRQERVIEEVKLVIKPYYSKRTITKEQYKEILRKAVPKVRKLETSLIISDEYALMKPSCFYF